MVVSKFLFSQGHPSWIRDVWTAGEITPLVSRTTVDELIRVLLAAYLPYCETVRERLAGPDQKFLELAALGGAMMLVTGDRDLLRLDGQVTFFIVTPAEGRSHFRGNVQT